MKYITYVNRPTYSTALLVKSSAFTAHELEATYSDYLASKGIDKDDLVLVALPYNDKGKAPVKFIKEQLEEIMLGLSDVGVEQIYCADANYFKVLANQRKAEPHLGYMLPCTIKDYEHIQVTLGVNHKSLIYNPNNEPKLQLSLDTLVTHINGSYAALGADVIHSGYYPESVTDIAKALKKLHDHDVLTCDIEAFSLNFDKAGLGTISFAWDQHNGVAFCCDYKPSPKPVDGNHGEYVPNPEVQALLRNFFETYRGKLVFQNATYDIKVMIYVLWMKNLMDTNGLLKGLEILTRDFEDTKIIAYLATNSTARNELGLKVLAQPFAGNYAEDVKDIRKVPRDKLLRYNLVDTLSTYYVLNTYYPRMCDDNQLEIYRNLMLPSQQVIIQMELTGMPLDPTAVAEARKELEAIVSTHQQVLDSSALISQLNKALQHEAMVAKNATLKVKQHPIEHFADVVFNPGSPKQLQNLLYKVMQLPILDYTDTKQAATGAKTLKKLLNHTDDPEHIAILEALMGMSKASKVLGTFIPAFEKAIHKGDNSVTWLHGNFNLGGTVSGRLSSSSPNLQNIPSGSTFGKLVKQCFKAPKGWIFSGADFSSLEDYISALTTRDPNKLKVYEQGFDGHCLRAYAYFKDEMPDIQQANDSERCFKLEVGNQTILAKEGDMLVLPTGQKIPAEDYADGIPF